MNQARKSKRVKLHSFQSEYVRDDDYDNRPKSFAFIYRKSLLFSFD